MLIGTETNILPDGSPDYDDDLLAELDWVVGSVHTSFGEPTPTKRIVTACEHPWIDAIGHPTGRKIERRPPYAVDMNEVIEAAARTGTMLEINSAPDRRDLNDVHARAAREAGVRILIDSDAHGANTLGITRWGIATARRAWLTKADVANTRPGRSSRRCASARAHRRGQTPSMHGAGAAGARSATTRSTAARLKGSSSARRARGRPPAAAVSAMGFGGVEVDRHSAGGERGAEGRASAGVGVGGEDELGRERARERQRRVGAGRGGRDERAAVGERLELRDAVVLAPRAR